MVDIGAAFRRSLALGAVVMALTVLLSVLTALAFRKRLRGANALFFVTIASLIMPSIVVSPGHRAAVPPDRQRPQGTGRGLGLERLAGDLHHQPGLFSSALGAHLTWTLPFGLLIMFAVFNRFNPAYEEAARDLGATPWQTLRHVVLPLIARLQSVSACRLHAELGRDRAHLAGDRRCQHAAAGAAGA